MYMDEYIISVLYVLVIKNISGICADYSSVYAFFVFERVALDIFYNKIPN